MNRQALVGMAALALAATGTAMAQPDVYDVHGRLVGEYESTTPIFTQSAQQAETAIRNIDGVQVALQVAPSGFVDSNGVYVASTDPNEVYFSGPNCNGQAYMPTAYDTTSGLPGQTGEKPVAPLVQNSMIVNGVAYYLNPASYGFREGPTTICSVLQTENFCFPYGRGCAGVMDLEPATVLNLSTLHLTAPFSVK